MVIDEGTSSEQKREERKPREATPEEIAAHQKVQRVRDEQTVFGLAVLAMQIHTGTLLKNKNQVANAFLKIGVMLKQNPGFGERFKAAQEAVVAQAKDMRRKSIVVPDKRLVTPQTDIISRKIEVVK